MAETEPFERADLLRLLGGWDIAFGAPQAGQTRPIGAALVQDLTFPASTGARIPATWSRPAGQTGAGPALLYCHAHGNRPDIGRAELTGGRPMLSTPYLGPLTDLGFSVLCIDMPGFGGRGGATESALAKERLWQGRCLFGQMIAELRAGIGWLAEQPGVDPARIGAMGLSMGATHAWWLAALDDRVAAAVQICAFADLEMLVDSGAHDLHGPYMTVPGLLALTSTGRLAGLAAPRPQLVCAGLDDPLTPEPAFRRALAELTAAYARAHAADALEVLAEPGRGHQESAAMRVAVLDFLRRRLTLR
jgi:dienelactone hydrolase